MANWFDQYFGFAPKANEQDGVWSFGIPQGQAPDVPLWPSPQMPPQSDDPFERAAQRTRQSVQPQGGRTEGMATTLPEDFLIPKTPLDYAMYATMGPFRLPAKAAMLGIGAAMGSEPTEAGPLQKIVGGIKAWHGSPHDFDKFDLGKIGTGEGAQTYGRGLYFAENEGVAQSYRNRLTKPDRVLPDEEALVGIKPKWDEIVAQLRAERVQSGERITPRSAELQNHLDALNDHAISDTISRKPWLQKGRMYEVNLNARPEQFLDWDRPVSMDAPVRGRLKQLGDMGLAAHEYGIDRNFAKESVLAANNPSLTGEGVYRAFGKAVDAARPKLKEAGNPRAMFGDLGSMMTDEVRGAGYPGIKYLDQGSRGFGQGTSNYVVFDDKLIDILKKYGITLPGAGAAIAASREQNN